MEIVLIMTIVQAAMGAFDNFWHHELSERLPTKVSARTELQLHTIREFLYAAIFLAIGCYAWYGAWAWALAAIFAIEIVVTLADFVVEDQTRKLPKLERITHTVLAINFGAILAFLIPEMLAWSREPAAVVPQDYGLLSWIMSVLAVGVFFWALRDAAAVVALTIKSVPEWQRKPFRAGQKAEPRRILVTGGTGFIGGHLCRKLVGGGDRITVFTRDPIKARNRFGPHVEITDDLGALDETTSFDAIINLAGAPTAGWLWTPTRKRLLLQSRLDVTRDVVALIGRMTTKPEVLISGSAIGFYGVRDDTILVEDERPQDIFMSTMCQEWEAAAETATEFGVRVCTLRIGLVLGKDGGVWPRLAMPTRFGLGTIMGSGRQVVSWIHVTDLVAMVLAILSDREIRGPVNATAPHAVCQRQFARTLGRSLHRPVWLKVPKLALKSVLGELADLFVEGQRVRPAKMLKRGFQFTYPDLEMAMTELARPALTGRQHPIRRGKILTFYNGDCPVCRAEIDTYQKMAARTAKPISFFNSVEDAKSLEPFGIGAADARKRLYVLDRNGQLRGGVDAVIAIWMELPGYRWAFRLASTPGIYHIFAAIYDGLLAPQLAAWAERRKQKRAGILLTSP